MTELRVFHAVERRIVRLPNGQTGKLLYLPGPLPHRSGCKARVALPSGAIVGARAEDLVLVDEVTEHIDTLDGLLRDRRVATEDRRRTVEADATLDRMLTDRRKSDRRQS